MFPVVKVRIEGLDPMAMYSVELEFVQIGCNRWKYMNGDWVTGGKAEPPPTFNRYTHPEAPHFGRHWMKEEISFSKVKLTNKPSPQNGQVSNLSKYTHLVCLPGSSSSLFFPRHVLILCTSHPPVHHVCRNIT